MADWRKRALSASDWKARALRDEPEASDVPDWSVEAPTDESERPGAIGAAVAGAGQGISKRYADEFFGLANATFNRPENPGAMSPKAKALIVEKFRVGPNGERKLVGKTRTDPRPLAPDQPSRRAFGDVFRDARDLARTLDERAKAEHGKAYGIAEFAGNALTEAGAAIGTAGASLTPAGQATMAGIEGLGRSNADLTDPSLENYGTAALETGGSALLGYGFAKSGEKLGQFATEKGLPWVRGKLVEASERAAAMGSEKAKALIEQLRGIAGGEGQKASRIVRTLQDLPGAEPVADSAARISQLRASAEAAVRKADELAQQATAAGLTESVADAGGKLISPGSKVEGAIKAKALADQYRAAAKRLSEGADELARGGVGAAQASAVPARQAAMASPEFRSTMNRVVEHAAEDLPGQAAKADAARAAYRSAAEGAPGLGKQYADEILSGKAAKDAVMARVLRYGPPIAGSVAGSMFGGTVGAATGAGLGVLAGRGLEAMAGAGVRPALRSWLNLVTKYPAVTKVWAGTLEKVLKRSPDVLGKYGPILAREYALNPARALVLDKVLTEEGDEEYLERKRRLVEAELTGETL